MSRTNPFKKKRRAAKTTMLVYGEGQAEEMFLKYLRGVYDRKIVVVDNDKIKTEMESARKKAKEFSIVLIENTPCLEASLLAILEDKDFSAKSSAWCKRKFEKEYIGKKQRTEMYRYENVFPKRDLEKRRKKVDTLNQLILAMEGK